MRKYRYKYVLNKVKDSAMETVKIQRSDEIYNYLKPIYDGLTDYQEHFICVFLDRQNKIIGHEVVSSGGQAGTVVDIKIIGRFALGCLASSVIFSHNHPSENKKPSKADINITKMAKRALSLFDIDILDHIIYCKDQYYSFSDCGDI